MRFHCPSLPHTNTTDAYSWCAYSSKVKKFCDMMMSLGHEVYLYGGSENEADCTEFISCLSEDERKGYFGDVIPEFDPDHPGWSQFNETAIYEIGKRKQPRDFLALIGGTTQKPIADAHPDLMTVEFGIGYSGVFAQFKVFESYAWMHAVYGERTGASNTDGSWYDAVIPNYWDPKEFPLGNGSGDYLLYIGRLIERKGVQIAVQAAKAAGKKLVVAGSGDYRPWTKHDDVDYVGSVGPKERGLLMGNAVATLVPTTYLEPFGGVSVESLLTGTPAITTDWGAFCVPEEAEILTRRGWVSRRDVHIGEDETLGLDVTTGLNEWTLIEAIHAFPQRETIEWRNRNWAVRVTEGHRWAMTKETPSGDKTPLMASFEDAQGSRFRARLAVPAVGGDLPVSAADAALVGWLICDGSVETTMRDGTRRAFTWGEDPPEMVGKPRIWQSKPSGVAAVREVLATVPHTETGRSAEPSQLPRRVFRVEPEHVRDVIRRGRVVELGLSGFVLGLSQEARQAFLQACVGAEGWQASSGPTVMISQNYGDKMEAMALCAYLCGHRPTINRNGERNGNVSLCRPDIAPIALRRAAGRVEDVWCPTTTLGTWTMRLDGHIVLTGNSENIPAHYRCRNLQQFVNAIRMAEAENSGETRRERRQAAQKRWSMDVVKYQYQDYFERLSHLYGGGWYHQPVIDETPAEAVPFVLA